jgi:AAA+ ATPase superfamily predicted ATPase
MSERFVDRAAELKILARSWQSKQAQLIVVLGRRRVGKTALLRHFAQDRTVVHFIATRLPEAQQLAELGEAIGTATGDPVLAENGFHDWRQVFTVLARGRNTLALVLDEFPYLVESSPALPSLLQRAWDQSLASTRAWLVLCGSSIAMMERETLDARAPLYGRRTGQIRLGPLPFDAVRELVPGWKLEDAVRAYAVFGGIPQYLQLQDSSAPVLDSIAATVLAPGAPLRDEVEYLLRQELVEARVYSGILAAIAEGKQKLGEIVNATHVPPGNVSKYLGVLQSLGLVVRDVPATESAPEKSKRGLYRIADPFVRFYFRHVRRHWSRIELGQLAPVLEAIKEDLDLLASIAYEDLCRQHVAAGALGGPEWARVGRWWDRQNELDIVAVNSKQTEILVGECKWSSKPVGTNVLATLEEAAAPLRATHPKAKRRFALFSRSGFTTALISAVRTRGDVALVHALKVVIPFR